MLTDIDISSERNETQRKKVIYIAHSRKKFKIKFKFANVVSEICYLAKPHKLGLIFFLRANGEYSDQPRLLDGFDIRDLNSEAHAT